MHLAKRLDVVRIGRDARDDVGIARLNRARRAPERHHSRRAAGRDVVEPARTQAEVLRHADNGVGHEREAADGEAVDLLLGDPRALDEQIQRGELREIARTMPGKPNCWDLRELKRRRKKREP